MQCWTLLVMHAQRWEDFTEGLWQVEQDGNGCDRAWA